MQRWRGWAAGGCGVAIGAGVVGGGGTAAVAAVALAVVSARWKDGARALLEGQTAGEVTFDDLDLSLGAIGIDGFRVRLGPEGEEILRIDRLSLGAGPAAFRLDPVRIGVVEVTGVTVSTRRDEQGWVWPPTVEALISGGSSTYDWPAVEIGELVVTDMRRSATGSDGTTTCGAARFVGHDLRASLDGGLAWTLRDAALQDAHAEVGGRTVAEVATVTMTPEGELLVHGLLAVAAVRADRTLELPPVAADFAPEWMRSGPSSEPWLGSNLDAMPWRPTVVRLRGARVTLTDATFGSSPVVWDFVIPAAEVGPLADEPVPFSGSAAVAGGEAEVRGTLASDGRMRFNVDFAGDARFFEPYLRSSLRGMSLALSRGQAAARLDVDLIGSEVAITGTITGTNVKFGPANPGNGGSTLVGLGSRILTANDDQPYTVAVAIRGDLLDPAFSPVDQVVSGVERTLVGRATGVVERSVGAVKSTIRKVFGRDD